MSVVIGHRGAARLAPENTLPGFQRALEAGVDGIELDVRLTRDGVPVCFHDDRLDRLTPLSGRIRDCAWPELRQVSVLPGAFGGRYPEASIPRLHDVLRELGARTLWLIELKADPGGPPGLARAVVDVLSAVEPPVRARIISFDDGLLLEADALTAALPEARRPPLGLIAARGEPGELLDRSRRLGADALHLQHRLWTPALVAAARDAGLATNAWTVNDTEAAHTLSTMGLDEITTDDPPAIRRPDAGRVT